MWGAAAADPAGTDARRRRQHAAAVLLLVLCQQLGGLQHSAAAAIDAVAATDAAPAAGRKHITLRGRFRGGPIYSTSISKSNSALQQVRWRSLLALHQPAFTRLLYDLGWLVGSEKASNAQGCPRLLPPPVSMRADVLACMIASMGKALKPAPTVCHHACRGACMHDCKHGKKP
jgi:hypothetical protein